MNIGRRFVEARRHQALQSVFCPGYRANVLVRFLFHFLSTIPRPKMEAISHFAVLHSNSTMCSTHSTSSTGQPPLCFTRRDATRTSTTALEICQLYTVVLLAAVCGLPTDPPVQPRGRLNCQFEDITT